MQDSIYLDHNASTPVLPEVLEKMLPYFSERFGNVSSKTHNHGWTLKNAVEKATVNVAKSINCVESELVFTSGATESINMAMNGVFELYHQKGNHIVTVKSEHRAVLDCCKNLEKKGARITYLDVDGNGQIDLAELEKSITDETIFVAIMMANNETGVIHPIKEISKIVHDKNSIFLCDATQAIGKLKVDVQKLGIDLLPISAHKFYGPQGVGALYIRRKSPRVKLSPLIHGGGQQNGLRAGTLNVAGIVGLSEAIVLATENTETFQNKMNEIRELLLPQLQKIGFKSNTNSEILSNTLNLRIEGVKASELISKTRKLSYSLGSACSSENVNGSHVLAAMGLNETQVKSSIRLSMGLENHVGQVDEIVNVMKQAIDQVKASI